jgi:glycosyltransferase involved in cell wall biosynthesis
VKLAFVVQRYGADIAGGSESHCRQLAERLSSRHDITVLTTCARDYVTWANAFPAGSTLEKGVRVLRFPVARQRRMKTFSYLSDLVFDTNAPRDEQEDWFRENGPDAPALLDHLRTHGREYDLVAFWAYRYAPTFFGLPLVAERAILVPTAEDDPAINLDVLPEYFRKPVGYLFLTPEERGLVSSRAGQPLTPSAVAGIGLDPAASRGDRAILERLDVRPPYVLYLGRVDRNKGCDTLLEYFQQHAVTGDEVTLVLAGPAKLQIPSHPRIRALGYVADNERLALLAGSRAVVVPSPYESLSIVLLEAWNQGVPALVNGRCAVLAGQVSRANGGLLYRSAAEFGEALDYLLANEAARDSFGRQGLAYVEREYRWPTVLAKLEGLLAEVASSRT